MELKKIVEIKLKNDKTSHNYNHALRVLKNAREIAKYYKNVDYQVLDAACLLHDISFQHGFVKNHPIVGAKQCKPILKRLNFSEDKIQKVSRCILNHMGNLEKSPENPKKLPIEAKILRDADNLDALGSIGIIRYVEFANSRGYPYFKSKKALFGDSVYSGVKALLTWPDKMLTKEGRKIAKKRCKIMRDFLNQFEKEYSK